MSGTDPRLGRLLVLGKDFGSYGQISSTTVGSEAAAAVSVGIDMNSPSKQFKYDARVDNEDAMCVLAAPDWIGLAVADAHYGPESSHMLIERLHNTWAEIRPTSLDHLQQMVEFLSHGEPAHTESETTLLVAAYDRASRQGFGVSFGDSTLSIVGPDRNGARVNPHDNRFVRAHRRSLRRGGRFTFSADDGDLIVIYSDGIDGCHYRNPETSVQAAHIQELASHSDFEPLAFVNNVVSLALGGVDGHPGGQDNIVMAAARA